MLANICIRAQATIPTVKREQTAVRVTAHLPNTNTYPHTHANTTLHVGVYSPLMHIMRITAYLYHIHTHMQHSHLVVFIHYGF